MGNFSKLAVFLLLAVSAMAQQVRFDSVALGPKGPIPNVIVSLCGATATGIPCSPQVTSTTDSTGVTACSLGSPVTPAGSNTCQGTTDALGNFGFWLTPGGYQYCLTGSGVTGKCYNLTVPVGVNPDGSAAINSLSPVSLSVSKVLRDCRQDGVVCNATWNGTTLTGTDDSAAINACLANAYAAGQGAVQLPSGQCRVNTTINDTNKPNLDVYGSNSNEDWSTTTTGQNFGITLTQLLCNTGSTPCWDATGTGRSRLMNFGERMANGFPSPSEIGFMFGRDNAVSGTGWITGTGTFCFTEENKLENIWVYADTRPAATAVGTVGVYNVGAEQMQILGGGFIADNPLFITATNDLALASPYQTLATGCPASMSEMKIGHGVNLQAWTKSAIDMRGIIDFESEKDTEILNGLIGTNHNPAVIINSGSNVPTNITLQGQDEGFDFPLTLNTSVEAIDARMTAVAPTAAGLIVVGNGITVSDSYFNMPQINGTLQPLFNVLSGTATIRGSILYEGKNSGSGAGANNLTLTGSTIYAPGLTDGVVNTFKAGSNYAVNDATGMSIVGNYSITNLGVGAGATANAGILENNSNLTGTAQIGVQSAPACSSAATVGCEGMRSRFDTAASSFTVTTGDAIHVVEGVKGAGSTITTEVGLDIDTLSNGATNFAIRTGNNTSQFGGPIVATSTITPSQTAGIVGTTTNNNANAGSFGEVISSTIATGSSVTLSTGTTANITSVSLTAGDWDCTGAVDFTFGATTSYTNLIGGISTTSATLGGQDTKFDFETPAAVPTATADSTFPLPIVRESLSGTTTVFLVTQGTFTVSTLKAYGTIRCRRMR